MESVVFIIFSSLFPRNHIIFTYVLLGRLLLKHLHKNIEFTAETGKTKSYGSGYGDKVPSKSGYYKFEFIKYYTIRTKKIDVYKYGEYKYTYYVYDPSYSLSHRWVRL